MFGKNCRASWVASEIRFVIELSNSRGERFFESDELRLNTVKDSANQVIENPVFPIARMKYENPLSYLFAIYLHLPKLKVAGSIPVSRSILLALLSL